MTKHADKKNLRPRVPLPLSDIQEEFRAQLKLLSKSCDAYDAGDRDEFRRIATSIRILVYDLGRSKSILKQIGLGNTSFLSYTRPINPRNDMSSTQLVQLIISSEGMTYKPRLDDGLDVPRLLSFDEWWNEEVFRSPNHLNQKRVSMARSGFVLYIANQAGGAHVDAELDQEFHQIAKLNAAGWVTRFGEVEIPSVDLEKAYIRHIGFEVLKTLLPEWVKIRGNRMCECGSGKKYRYCHGRGLKPYL